MKGKTKLLILLVIVGFFAYSYFSTFWFYITTGVLILIAFLALITKVTEGEYNRSNSQNGSCILGGHSWQKVGGPRNIGGGNFEQTLKCTKCNKRKDHRS